MVSDHSIAFHLQPLTSIKDMSTTQDVFLYKRCIEWQKYPASNIRGSCNSCDRAAVSKLTSVQSRPPRICQSLLENVCHASLSSTHYSYFLCSCSFPVSMAYVSRWNIKKEPTVHIMYTETSSGKYSNKISYVDVKAYDVVI